MHFTLLETAQMCLSKWNGRNQKATNVAPKFEKKRKKGRKKKGNELHLK